MVISFLNKDYEIQSWNKQGEITKIEGMLTIAFLVIYLCSHIDNRKQLYLIMKIPYSVNMPLQYQTVEEIKRLKEENKELKEKIKQQDKKIIELEHRINELEKENQELKEILGEKNLEWRQTGNKIHRYNPETKKFESYEVPIILNKKRITDYEEFTKKFIIKKRKPEKWVNFFYPRYFNFFNYYYEMPISAYKFLIKQGEEITKITVESIKKQIPENIYKNIGKPEKFDELLEDIIKSDSDKINVKQTAKQLNLDRITVRSYLRTIERYTKGEFIIDETGKGHWKIKLKL